MSWWNQIRSAIDPTYADEQYANQFFATTPQAPGTNPVKRPRYTSSYTPISNDILKGLQPGRTFYPGDVGYQFPEIPNIPSARSLIWSSLAAENFLKNKKLPTTTTATTPTGRGAAPVTSPNTIVQRGDGQDGISDEYRAQLGNWQALQKSAAGALKGFQPGSGSMPDAATKAAQAGQDLWAKLHPDLAKPGGAVGTYNPLMQARGDVPSMADLWSGMRSIQSPTAGPGRTSEDVTDEAMAKARAEGRYFEPSGTMGGFAPAADPATQQRMQQFGTAMQAQKGTEETSAAQRSQDFVNKFKLGSLNPGSYNFPSYDANAMMNAPSALFK